MYYIEYIQMHSFDSNGLLNSLTLPVNKEKSTMVISPDSVTIMPNAHADDEKDQGFKGMFDNTTFPAIEHAHYEIPEKAPLEHAGHAICRQEWHDKTYIEMGLWSRMRFDIFVVLNEHTLLILKVATQPNDKSRFARVAGGRMLKK